MTDDHLSFAENDHIPRFNIAELKIGFYLYIDFGDNFRFHRK